MQTTTEQALATQMAIEAEQAAISAEITKTQVEWNSLTATFDDWPVGEIAERTARATTLSTTLAILRSRQRTVGEKLTAARIAYREATERAYHAQMAEQVAKEELAALLRQEGEAVLSLAALRNKIDAKRQQIAERS
ncbi:MAG: hypothetical protein U0350_10960 [Caldilineaceae bacterium]